MATPKKDGLVQATASIASFAGLYYVGDLINDCKINSTKYFISMTILITLFLYLNIEIWFSNLKSLTSGEGSLYNGKFVDTSRVVRSGVPYLTDNKKHEILLAYGESPVIGSNTIGYSILHKSADNTDNDNPDAKPAISTQYRTFYNLSFSIILSALVTGIFAFAK